MNRTWTMKWFGVLLSAALMLLTVVSPSDSGRQVELKSPSAKSEGGRRGMSPSWYCHPRQSASYSRTRSRTAR